MICQLARLYLSAQLDKAGGQRTDTDFVVSMLHKYHSSNRNPHSLDVLSPTLQYISTLLP